MKTLSVANTQAFSYYLNMQDSVRKNLPRVLIAGIVILGFIGVMHNELRDSIRLMLRPPYRQVLAITSAMFDGHTMLQVLKIKTDQGLYLEVYDSRGLQARTKLIDKKDGYLTFAGNVTNLVIDDVDSDRVPDIIAPSFDDQLTPHVNVYKFDPVQKRLETMAIR